MLFFQKICCISKSATQCIWKEGTQIKKSVSIDGIDISKYKTSVYMLNMETSTRKTWLETWFFCNRQVLY